MVHANHADPREAPLLQLLAATESLVAALADRESPDTWDELFDRRNDAFAALERAASDETALTSPLTAVARACLDRIAALDGAILAAGREGLMRLQQERLALGSRRRAVQAHGVREREVARAITVKA